MEISKDHFIINFGVHVRQLREKNNMSQQDLANDCNISKRQIGRIERGEINTTLKTIVIIANALQVEPKELLNFSMKQ
ncbi:helix-turn-helix domain-containing protein [Flavobacterium anhuiense]|uniref:helix-turn-helix domain-containing protein n=1 Tax=Flavobacterium anhuiense TaxID=459526 RepID=UPI003D97C068